MPASVSVYPHALRLMQNGTIDVDSDTLKLALVTASYVYSGAHVFFSDITNEITGTGYTAGGTTISGVTLTTTLADAWATPWTAATVYTAGQVIRPSSANGYLYQCVVGGTSHATIEPTWSTTRGINNTDGTVTWLNIGRSVTVFDCANASWSNATISASGAILYEDTGVASTSGLILYNDFGEVKNSSDATFTVTIPTMGLLVSAAA